MFLILTPLVQERDHLLHFLTEGGCHSQIEQKGHLSGHLFKEQALALFVGGHGKTQFAIQTQHLIHHSSSIKGILCVGAAGSLTSSVKPGDMVLASQTIEHDYNLKFVKRPLPSFAADSQLLSRAQAVVLPDVTIHTGFIASGDEDIIESARANELAQKTSAIAVAWEGAGAARACQYHRIPFLEVRVITDFADKHAPADFATHLRTGMSKVAQFLRAFSQG